MVLRIIQSGKAKASSLYMDKIDTLFQLRTKY